MKIGILTLPFNNNYGGYLQAYALMTILKQMGHEPELIYRKHNKRSVSWRITNIIKNTIKMLLGRRNGILIPNQEKELRLKGKNMMSFVDKYITPRTCPLYSTSELRQFVNERYDTIIVGSDQVWRPDYVPDVENFFLTFLKDKSQRVAYAASFGTDKPVYTDKEKKECGNGIKLFDLVSVREQSAIDVFSAFGWVGKKNPVQVLDPTMLLDKTHYERLLQSKPSEFKGKILCYILDSNDYTRYIIKEIESDLKKDSIDFIDADNWKRRDFFLPSIESWLMAFRDADFIVTDSFHGTVFSIVFNKPFVTITNNSRGADRFTSLLSVFELQDCLYIEGEKFHPTNIDWLKVNSVLRQRQTESLEFLKLI